jgi:steroid delta-isomerase-like uncharacterized protein
MSDMPTESPVSQWIAAFNTHDVAKIVSLYHDDAELDDAGMKHPRHGKRAIEGWFTKRFQSMPAISYTPIEYICQTETRSVVTWTTRSKGPIPGRQRWLAWLARSFAVDGVSVFVLRDGLIVKQRGYYDHLAVIQQILPPLKYLLPVRF